MGLVKNDDGWRLPDELWEQMEPLLPPRKPHPLGGHNPRVSDRAAMDAPVCAAYGMPVECVKRYRDLFEQFSTSQVGVFVSARNCAIKDDVVQMALRQRRGGPQPGSIGRRRKLGVIA